MSDDRAPAPAPDRDTSKHGNRLSPAKIATALALHSEGTPMIRIAEILGCDRMAISRAVREFTSTTDVAAKYLAGQALKAAKHWSRASKEGAAKGRHEPAKDLLLHTGAISPVESGGKGEARVAVFIGLPGQPAPQHVVPASSQPSVIDVTPQPVVEDAPAPLLLVDDQLT